MTPEAAFRATVARFEGSVAIAASTAGSPDELHLALCGSGQSLYIGLAEDAFVVASEPYGLVEETPRYVRMDGETTQGQVVTLRREGAGTLAAMERARYDGGPLPLDERDVVVAEITTRDIDRADFHHFLLKELTEAPASFRKTLRGRITTGADGRLAVRVGEDTIPPGLTAALAEGTIGRVIVIGQGTAAVAGQAVAAAVARFLPGLHVTAMPATELSGFGLADDMSDTLVIAISQSGTTTDTNRTVDLVRTRGAHVLAVVNRRNSDLVAKVHGVLHTSDGRDVEMSVASTKAFYAQVAAGWLLAGALATAHRRPRPGARRPAGPAGGHGAGAGPPGRDRPDRSCGGAAPTLLGGRRQRTRPHRCGRSAHQAVRAVLPLHLERRHRGQEAHRPVVRAADPGVRRRPARPECRRRRQGGRHLPGPQGRPRRGGDRGDGRAVSGRRPAT